jgi:hypothetical protein
MNLREKYRRKETIAERQIAGDAFLVPVCGRPEDLQKIFVLNPVADFIWSRLDGEHDLEELLEAVVGQFEVERDQARLDMVEFVEKLLEQNLLEGGA